MPTEPLALFTPSAAVTARACVQLSLPDTDTPEALPALETYDWIVVSSSAGKDSMAMLDYVATMAEESGVLSRVVVVHADLGRVEWPGTPELAEQQAARYGVRFVKVSRKAGDLLSQIEGRGKFPGPETRFCTAHHKTNQVARVFTALAESSRSDADPTDLLSHVESRGMWPDPRRRYCTSDHKRGPIRRVLTALTSRSADRAKWRGGPVRILSCMGMRGEESPARAKKRPFVRDESASNGRRHVDAWLPLHRWTETEVWSHIRASRNADLIHPAYSFGMPRLSCCFCIFAPKDALIVAGHHNPELLAEYVRVEAAIGHRFRMNLSMADVAAAVAAGEKPATVAGWRM